MYFNKFPHPANFEFLAAYRPGKTHPLGAAKVRFAIRSYEGDLYRITVESPLWKRNFSLAGLTPPAETRFGQGDSTTLSLDRGFGLTLRDAKGKTLLASPAGNSFGVCGVMSMFTFLTGAEDRFYGLGEKWTGFEHSGKRTKFWNTDAYADFSAWACKNDRIDPVYVSIPYLIIKRGDAFVGLLLDNPMSTYVTLGVEKSRPARGEPQPLITLGGEDGQPDLWILVGPSLPELTRKMQKLVGTTPVPPAWALGYHQCRWGYKSEADLTGLDRNFRKHKIPCDGLWLDIDYMERFKVFTFDRKHFRSPAKALAKLAKAGRKVVPIIDPGVKVEAGYPVYERGRKAGAFCRNPQGKEYVGVVWPGESAFPDFSDASSRAWWTEEVKRIAALGLHGAWLDMNDPSTAHAHAESMLFEGGKAPHEAHHNQFALGMAMASREGFLKAHPGERPFLICRSGSTGIHRYTGIWTGDNASNYHQLRTGITCSLNLALSGVPLNAMDIGGFYDDTNAPLFEDWMKACFLFPFARTHTTTGTRAQEPWAFGPSTLAVLRRYIRLRYRFRPYLYNLFIRHEETGEAVLRPLFHDFADTPALPLDRVDDQFLVGPAVMQAPFVVEKQKAREAVLPAGVSWFAAADGKWLAGGRRIRVRAARATTPLFLREGTILPLAADPGASNAWDGARVEFHVLLHARSNRQAWLEYAWDDGRTFDYRKGKRSRLALSARAARGALTIETKRLAEGCGRCRPSFVLYERFRKVTVDGRPAKLKKERQEIAGRMQTLWRVVI